MDRGAIEQPAGSIAPADLHRLDKARNTIEITGRRRSVSWIDALRYGLLAGAHLSGEALSFWGWRQALDRPGKRVGGRLVAGDQQRHQLVAQLLVAHRAAVLVGGLQQQRHDVVALGQVAGTAGAQRSPRRSGRSTRSSSRAKDAQALTRSGPSAQHGSYASGLVSLSSRWRSSRAGSQGAPPRRRRRPRAG